MLEQGMPIPVVISVYLGQELYVYYENTAGRRAAEESSRYKKRQWDTEYGQSRSKVTRAQLEEIVKAKEPDLNAADMDAAVRIIAGSARSMGMDVEGL